jgi:heptosyltransferase-3
LANVERIKGGGIDRQGINKILLIQFGDLGDVIVTFPCLRALKASFPDAFLVMAVHEKAQALANACQWVDEVLSIETPADNLFERLRQYIRFIIDVRRADYDTVFDLRTGDRSAILSLLTGAKQRISFFGKYNKIWRNRIYTHLVYPDKSPNLHMAAYYLSLLNAYGIDTDDSSPRCDVSSTQNIEAEKLLQSEKISPDARLIAFHPFSLWDYKAWGLEKHAAIMDWIADKYDASVIITGTAAQQGSADLIVQQCKSKVVNLAGKTPLGLMPALLKRCAVSIGVDTAGGHIAAAVGTPTITIFGPGNFHQWAPLADHGKIVHKHWDCVPCKQMGCDGNEISRCLDELSVAEVKSDIEEFLDGIFCSLPHHPGGMNRFPGTPT